MLGEKIGEENVKAIVQRVLMMDGDQVLETSAQTNGTILGVEVRNRVTYTARMRPDGSITGEARGLVMGKGGETATFVGHGVARMTAGGGVSWRGAHFFHSTHAKFNRLNTIAAVFEYELDAEGNGRGTLHEWK